MHVEPMRTVEAWWPRASLRRDEDFDIERKVSWLELFFDLVFVVILSRLAHDLAHHLDVQHLIDFALLFAAVFWAWNAFTFYIERFESGGLENRLFVFAAMAASAAIAVWTEGGLSSHFRGFAIAFLITRAVNMVQWTRAAAHVPEFRPVAVRFLSGFVVTAALVLVAMGLEGDARRLVFAAAVLLDIATPAFTLRQQAALPRLSTSKFPERFGLFTILVLGESVVGVITGVSEINEAGELEVAQIVNGGLGLLVGIGLWWVYFDFIARRPPKRSLWAVLGWVYLHLVTLATITATGAAISVAIIDSVEGGLLDPTRRLLVGSVGAALIGFALLEGTLARGDGEPTHAIFSPAIKAASGIALIVVGLMPLGWSSAAALAICVAALAVPAVYGAIVWYAPANIARLSEQDQPR